MAKQMPSDGFLTQPPIFIDINVLCQSGLLERELIFWKGLPVGGCTTHQMSLWQVRGGCLFKRPCLDCLRHDIKHLGKRVVRHGWDGHEYNDIA